MATSPQPGGDVPRGHGRAGLRLVLGLGIGAGLLTAVLVRVDWTEVGQVLAQSRPIWIVPIAASMLAHYVFKGLRWRILLAARAPVPRLLAVRLTYVGYFMNNLFPARLGELGRPYLLSLNVCGIPFSFALATLFGDKLFDLVFLVLCLLLSFAVVPLPEDVLWGMGAATVVSCAILAGGLWAAWWYGQERDRDGSVLERLARRGGRWGDRIYRTLLSFAEGLSSVSSPRRLALAFVHSLASFVLLGTTTWCCLEMVGIHADVLTCLFVMGLLGLSFLIPAPPTNAGNIHFFATHALVLLGAADLERAFAFAVVTHLNQVVTVSAAGMISLVGLDWRRLRDLAR